MNDFKTKVSTILKSGSNKGPPSLAAANSLVTDLYAKYKTPSKEDLLSR